MWSADDIRDLRERMGLNRTEFAKLLGVDARSVHRWEDPDGPRPKGSAAQILTGIRAQLDAEPHKAPQVLKILASAAAVGGLAYLLVRLLNKATEVFDESPGDRSEHEDA